MCPTIMRSPCSNVEPDDNTGTEFLQPNVLVARKVLESILMACGQKHIRLLTNNDKESTPEYSINVNVPDEKNTEKLTGI